MVYKANITRIIPPISANQLNISKCYMGVSIGQPNFTCDRFRTVLQWISRNSETCLIVIGDDLLRFNIMAEKGISEKASLIISRHIGESEEHFIATLTRDFFDCRFIITRWRNWTESQEFRDYHDALKILNKTDSAFADSVRKSANGFLSRRVKRRTTLNVPANLAVELSVAYLLEEISVFCLLASKGWNTEVYPGPELSVLEEIAKGKYQDVPPPLKHRINISLRVRKISKSN